MRRSASEAVSDHFKPHLRVVRGATPRDERAMEDDSDDQATAPQVADLGKVVGAEGLEPPTSAL